MLRDSFFSIVFLVNKADLITHSIKLRQENYNQKTKTFEKDCLKVEDKWIICKLNKTIKDVTKNIENNDILKCIKIKRDFIELENNIPNIKKQMEKQTKFKV